VRDVERAKENFLIAAELGHVHSMIYTTEFLDKDDPQRFFCLEKLVLPRMWYLSPSGTNLRSDS
jgi:hypothetical protein